jgi:hypothetical protein
MPRPFANASRRTLIVVNVVLVALSVALLVVAAAAMTGGEEGEPAPAPRVQSREPPALVTQVRTQSPVGRFEAARCRERDHAVEEPRSWFHPQANFYPADARAPSAADLEHLAARDGAVIVTYDPRASRGARAALRRWAAAGIGVVVAPSPARDPRPLEAYTATRRIVCTGVDLDRLTEFTDRHFSRPQDIDPHGEQSPRSRSGR